MAGLLALVAARAFALGGDGFAATSQHVSGTPVETLIQDGVGEADVSAVAAGVRASHDFTRLALGRTVRGPVQARIAHEDTCPGGDGDRSLIGEGSAGQLCVDTRNVEWQFLVRNHPDAAMAIPAHEYVHVLQAQLGCLPSGDDRDFRWIVEGMAGHMGWEALVWSGHTTDAAARRTLREDGAHDPSNEPLRHYERSGGRTPQYAEWHLAIRTLLEEAVAAGAAPRERPEMALIRFCERVGAGSGWRGAFMRSFGMPVFEFYARYAAAERGA
jgi:hypothetical protein